MAGWTLKPPAYEAAAAQSARRANRAIVAIGLVAGIALGLILDPPMFAGISDALGAYVLAPLLAAVNAGISCF